MPIKESLKPTRSNVVESFRTLLDQVKAPLPLIEIMVRDMVMQRIVSIFPVQVLRLLLKDLKTTVVVSALPGSKTPIVVSGYELVNMTYFNPNLSRIAIGIGMLTYIDKVHLSILVDKVRTLNWYVGI